MSQCQIEGLALVSRVTLAIWSVRECRDQLVLFWRFHVNDTRLQLHGGGGHLRKRHWQQHLGRFQIINARRIMIAVRRENGTFYDGTTALRHLKPCCTTNYVAVVSSVTGGGSASGHIGVVKPDYADQHTPFQDNPDVWVLPSTKCPDPPKK